LITERRSKEKTEDEQMENNFSVYYY